MKQPYGEFGTALRQWRERLSPATVGVPVVTSRRRTPGLRREDLGQLAGVSADYVKRLEQGRSRPSRSVLAALGRALRLSRPEYEQLCMLAGHTPPGHGRVPSYVGPAAQRMLDRLSSGPVAIYDAAWTQLAANPAYHALTTDLDSAHRLSRNLVWTEFTGLTHCLEDPDDAERFRASLAADLRASVLRYPADRDLADLVALLRRTVPEFEQVWNQAPVITRRIPRALFLHPQVGPLRLDLDLLTIHDGDLRVVVATAEPGSEDADRLALIEVLGQQDLTLGEPGLR